MTQASVRASGGIAIVILALIGKITGLNDKECGQIGVTQITYALGWTMEPPQLKLYAVDPVGVEMRTPSPYTVVRCTSFT